jgi:peroxiredoxin
MTTQQAGSYLRAIAKPWVKALSEGKVNSWPIVLGGAAVLAAAAIVLVWSLFARPMDGSPRGDASITPVDEHTRTSHPPLPAGAGSDPAQHGTQAATPAPPVAPSHLDRLFAALAMHRPVERTEAPDFILSDLEGQPVRLRDLRGKLVLLNFWATWCVPCRTEMPSMERLHQTFKGTEFALLAISIDRQGVELVRPFVEELRLKFSVLLDQTMEISRRYGLRGLPTTYLIDPEGRLISAAIGGRDWHSTEAKALIAGLLREAMATSGDPAQSRPTGEQ